MTTSDPQSENPNIQSDIQPDTGDVSPDSRTISKGTNGVSQSNFMVDFGPVLIFVILYNYLRRSDPDGAIYTAAIVFTVCAVMALAYSRIKHGKFSTMLALTTAIIILTVGLSLIFKDPRFFYMKPTVVNIVFGLLTIGGVFIKKNIIKIVLNGAFELPEKVWNSLAIRWGVFFFACAAINEIVWRHFGEAFWANFKLFGFLPLTILFTLSQIPFIMKHCKIAGQDG